MKLFGAIFASFGLLFMAIGGTLAWHQHRTISTSVPAQATVLSTDIERHTSSSSNGGSSTTYKPIVNFRYTVDGVQYESNQVHPMSQSSSHSWASSVVRKFPVGKQVEAYYNPKKPHKAFLINQHSFFPYIFILFPSIFVCIGIGIGFSSGASKVSPPVPLPSTGGWFEVKAATRIADRQRAAFFGMLLWDTIGILACGHFFLVAERPYGLLAIIATAVYAAIGCVPLVSMIYYARLRSTITDARLFTTAEGVTRGETITVGMRQSVRRQIMVQSVQVGFRCQETTKTSRGGKTSISTHTSYESLETVMENQQGRVGDELEYSAQITLPEEQSPSTPPKHKGYPKRRWSVRVVVKIPNSPDYRADFPVTVS